MLKDISFVRDTHFLIRAENSRKTFSRIFSYVIFFIFFLSSGVIYGKNVVRSLCHGSVMHQVYYELRVYHLKDSSQLAPIAAYLKDALIPALHKSGLNKLGLFYEQDSKLGTNVYLFRQVNSLEDLIVQNEKLQKDAVFIKASEQFNNGSKDVLLYDRIETIILKAFPMMEYLQVPNMQGKQSDRVYELRSYESSNELRGLNKIHMFNQGGEIPLFKRLDFNAVFYAQVIVGAHMPNLMYMTVFPSREQRDAHWKTFGEDAEWKKLLARPEYQNNVSKVDDHFLRALPGSDI